MNQLIFDLLNFCFPANCPVCGGLLPRPGMQICLPCERGLPRTLYSRMPDNPVAQLFWGRVPIEAASSLFRFEKGSHYQKLIHRLKYKGDQELGLFLGKLLGEDLCGTVFMQARYIIPVPLHPRRQKDRGYNQSELIARGIAQLTGMEVVPNLLERREYTDSQTRRNRYDRFTNVSDRFSVRKEQLADLSGPLLLVDDVVTTGATLEACALPLCEAHDAPIFVATVACA